MATTSAYLRSQYNNALKGVPFAITGGIDVRLFSVAPTAQNTGGTELSGGGYVPKNVPAANLVENGAGNLATNVDVSWTATGAWTVAALCIFAAGTNNLLHVIKYNPVKTFVAGDPVILGAGTLVLAVPLVQ